ncbi:AimR family lysis-lysogeny pheromone receptor [Bacillus thuringiensis]|uniref:HTH cro/C1-type domain-containing protein n=1 Tax=Bacillus thuringiensis subsp. higo TaxID=132266 RepID=A0A9X6LAE9_BACUH|nr:AimR family lysis-lysogeny pheromone receptor [Bacillus thuringiensis]OUB39971.1 hypothetical protein BK716_31340 [Bacillus thuringiensis serovar higo]
MKKLRNKVKDYRLSKNLSMEEFGKLVNIHKTTISRWNNGGLKDLSIYACGKIVSIISPGNKNLQEKDIQQHLSNMEQRFYINMKVAFVLGHLNGFDSLLKYIKNTCDTDDSLNFKRWSKIFDLYILRIKGGEVCSIYLKIQEHRVLDNELYFDLNIFCDILSMLCLCDLGDFELMESHKNRIYDNIKIITNSDLKKLLEYWVLEIWSYALLRNNEKIKFDDCQKKLRDEKDLEVFPVMKAFLDVRTGERFILTDYEKSLYFLNKGFKVLSMFKDNLKYNIALNNINFLKILHWKDIDTIDLSTLHPAEYAFFLIRKKRKSKAIKILKGILAKKGKLTPLQTCYLGMALDDLDMIMKSIDMFKAKNDFFFAEFASKVYNDYVNNLQ